MIVRRGTRHWEISRAVDETRKTANRSTSPGRRKRGETAARIYLAFIRERTTRDLCPLNLSPSALEWFHPFSRNSRLISRMKTRGKRTLEAARWKKDKRNNGKKRRTSGGINFPDYGEWTSACLQPVLIVQVRRENSDALDAFEKQSRTTETGRRPNRRRPRSIVNLNEICTSRSRA